LKWAMPNAGKADEAAEAKQPGPKAAAEKIAGQGLGKGSAEESPKKRLSEDEKKGRSPLKAAA